MAGYNLMIKTKHASMQREYAHWNKMFQALTGAKNALTM